MSTITVESLTGKISMKCDHKNCADSIATIRSAGKYMELIGANDTVIAGLTPEQRRLVDQVIGYMNPVAPRSAGAAFDNQAKMPNERIAANKAPTLILHATDDTLQLFHNSVNGRRAGDDSHPRATVYSGSHACSALITFSLF